MNEHKTYDIYYDEESDFLEVSFGESPETEYTEDLEEGVFITKDRRTNEVKNIGILNFKSRVKEAVLKRILSKLGMVMPLNIIPN